VVIVDDDTQHTLDVWIYHKCNLVGDLASTTISESIANESKSITRRKRETRVKIKQRWTGQCGFFRVEKELSQIVRLLLQDPVVSASVF